MEDPEVHEHRQPSSPSTLQGPILTSIVRRCRGEGGEEVEGVSEDRGRDVVEVESEKESEAGRAMVNTLACREIGNQSGCSVKKLMGLKKHRTFPTAGQTRTEKRLQHDRWKEQ